MPYFQVLYVKFYIINRKLTLEFYFQIAIFNFFAISYHIDHSFAIRKRVNGKSRND